MKPKVVIAGILLAAFAYLNNLHRYEFEAHGPFNREIHCVSGWPWDSHKTIVRKQDAIPPKPIEREISDWNASAIALNLFFCLTLIICSTVVIRGLQFQKLQFSLSFLLIALAATGLSIRLLNNEFDDYTWANLTPWFDKSLDRSVSFNDTWLHFAVVLPIAGGMICVVLAVLRMIYLAIHKLLKTLAQIAA